MNTALDLNYLSPGFDDPELGSQQTFRAMVKALDHPGHLVQIKSKLSVPEDLNLASAAMCLTLCHEETTVWADLNWNLALIEWFQYHCGCTLVTETCMANLALITKPLTMPPLDHFRISDHEQPDTATTIVIQVGELQSKTESSPILSGGNQMTTQSDTGVAANFWVHWYEQSNRYPLGFDIFLTCDDVLAAMP